MHCYSVLHQVMVLECVGPEAFLVSGIFIQNVLIGQTPSKHQNANSIVTEIRQTHANMVSEEPQPNTLNQHLDGSSIFGK